MSAIAVFLLVALPWLNPFAPAPTSSVGPLLWTWFCAGLLLALWAWVGRRDAREAWVQAIALGWLAAAALSAVMGLLQYFGAAAALGQWVRATEVGVAFANLRQRNQFATLLNLGLLALVWSALQGRVATGPVRTQALARPDGVARGAAGSAGATPMAEAAGTAGTVLVGTPALLVLAVLLGAANAASSSRTGLLQLVLVVVLVGLWGRWREPPVGQLMLMAVAAYGGALVALPWLAGLAPGSSAWARLLAGDAVCSSRATLWGNVLHLIAQKPWLGWGWGELDYAHFIMLYPDARFCDILDNAHNLPLHLAVELGVPAALLACGLVLWFIWRGKPWREWDATRQLAWGVLAVISLHSLLEYPLWYGPFQVAAVLCAVLLWRVPQGEGYQRFSAVKRDKQACLAIFIIAITLWVAWDYHRVRQVFLPPKYRAAAFQADTLAKAQGAWWFVHQVQFAELTTTPLTPANAGRLNGLSRDLLHFSPEPRVIEVLIGSAALLGRQDEVAFYSVRYRAAFPERYLRWANGKPGLTSR